jgi:hypothetical protein
MDFVGVLPTMKKGHDYLFLVVVRFNKICILMPCKNTIEGKGESNLFFEHIWVHFGIPMSIILDMDTGFENAFWTTFVKP